MPRTVAIMQPYFFPYGGYFRLFEHADLFVIYDCVQFPRRGYVHRNRLPQAADGSGDLMWLTLPLAKQARDVRICDLRFAPQAADAWSERLTRFGPLQGLDRRDPEYDAALRAVTDDGDVTAYLAATLGLTCARLGLSCATARSSDLDLPADLTGQDRILEIARAHGAEVYLNAPGGRALYEASAFAQAGIDLQFLPDATGPFHSVLFDIAQRAPRQDSPSP